MKDIVTFICTSSFVIDKTRYKDQLRAEQSISLPPVPSSMGHGVAALCQIDSTVMGEQGSQT